MVTISWADLYRITLLSTAVLWAAGAGPAVADETPEPSARPAIEVREPTHDAGIIEEGTAIKLQFTVANKGSADLELKRVKPDCGCSVARWEKVISPGKEGTIDAEVHTEFFRGKVTKGFTVFSNDPVTPEMRLSVTAQVKPLVNVTPGRAALLAVEDEPVSMEFTVERNGGHAMKIVDIVPNAAYLKGEWTALPGEGRYTVKVTATAETPQGRNVVPFVVKTDLPKAGMISLVLTVDRGIISVPPMLFYGLVPKEMNEPRQAAVTISRQKGGFHVKEATVDDPKLQAKLETVRDGGEYRITVVYGGGWEPGIVRKTLTITTDDPQQPVITIPIQAVVQVDPATLPPVVVR
jgi:hypothetical protein